MEITKILIGSDHAGYELKEVIKKHLLAKGIEVKDVGPASADSVDYPDFAHPVALDVTEKRADLGIVICGSGNGIAMTVNKHQGIRAALCWTKEIAGLARLHNNANVVSIPARFTSIQQAIEIVDTFISTDFEGGRHETRVNKIPYCS